MSELRIVKIGGSLLGSHDVDARLRGWLGKQDPATHVVIAGGGAVVNALRELDARKHVGDAACHAIAMRAMKVNLRIVGARFPDFNVLENLEQIRKLGNGTSCLLDTEESVMARPELPELWDFTSDSIAAWVAGEVGADEVVLLKSTLADTTGNLVDPFFQKFLSTTRCRIVNLLAVGYPESVLNHDSKIR